ncbi:MAG: dienelactone hydrolase family protein [archaeon]|nr:dienelactone hydrolase family protein [archaeon]
MQANNKISVPSIVYKANVEDKGEMEEVSNGEEAGTTGRSLRIKALSVMLKGIDGGIEISCCLESQGWGEIKQGPSNQWVTIGSSDNRNKIESIKMNLTGEAKKLYKLKYQVHVECIGWMDWIDEGEKAGPEGSNKRIEAIKIQIEENLNEGFIFKDISYPEEWKYYLEEEKFNSERIKEMDLKRINTADDLKLEFEKCIYGNIPEDGFSLVILLHPEVNMKNFKDDNKFKEMFSFFEGGFKKGTIVVSVKGLKDEVNMHYTEPSYPAIIRLIEDFIIFKAVNPNKIYLIGLSLGGDAVYQYANRIPFVFAAVSPQGGHPNMINVINQGNLPMYIAVGDKDGSYNRVKINEEYYNKIISQREKYFGKYIVKLEKVFNTEHEFKCWETPRKAYFDGSKEVTKTEETAFDFLYSFMRNPFPTELTIDTKTWLTSNRNHFNKRGNFFYFVEIGENPSEIISLKMDYENNKITVLEGNNFKIWMNSKMFTKDKVKVEVKGEGIPWSSDLQKDMKLVRENLKLFSDPYYAFDSYVEIQSLY